MTIEEKIKAGAKDLGFVAVGFTKPESPARYPDFIEWLQEGRHAGMGYLTEERSLAARKNPLELLPSCQSIICLALPYTPVDPKRKEPEQGRIASYALERDYHQVAKEKLNLLAETIREIYGQSFEHFACVDTAPILEKYYAQKAGLGWIGRNSLLINPDYGSWIFLSELLVSIEMTADQPFAYDGCGECQRCLQACPTQAILPNRTIDARRCLSYLTIENRGEISDDLKPSVRDWIFGCDICQNVCPANAAIAKRQRLKEQEPLFEAFPDLAASLTLSPQEFKQKYGDTPVWRAKYNGFRRNVAIAMGNSQQKTYLPILEKQGLTEKDAVVFQAIQWALEQLKK
jgi:epoxyqueuosine reductase